ncbi:Na+/H+ antiporter [Rhodovastum atsumiense]|uniref:Na+/H+ antiporter n=1 Tax=Rhodovastum atsumiense TaxID=504468 RepID=UPI001EEF9158|nr:Na+/H+ antiporter [Rhodovastum atsumiense]
MVTETLALLLAAVAGGLIVRLVPLPLPRPLVQIALGAAIGAAGGLRVELQPEVFFLLFLPPLLFLDGWRIPKEDMLRDWRPVLGLALGLVVFSVAGIGALVHALVPAMPLAVAFALAAILSPTDPIAVAAITARTKLPKRLMHVLEGEALLNDASGLICFRFAVAAALSGGFSLLDATLSFLWVATSGLAAGAAFTWLVTQGLAWVNRRSGEEIETLILVSLLGPFGSYILAESLHGSGILAAVASGVMVSFIDAEGLASAAARTRMNAVWDTIQFAANGVIFVLLGEQLPVILGRAAETAWLTGHDGPWRLAFDVLAITAGIVALRFAWVWVSLRLVLWRARRRGVVAHRPPTRLLAAASLAGVRGVVTLAGVMTLPVALPDGTAFPERDLAIFLAMAVIVLSLVIASIGLPPLLRGVRMPQELSHAAEEDMARLAAARAGLRAIERAQAALAPGHAGAETWRAAIGRIMELYRSRTGDPAAEGADLLPSREAERIERTLFVAAIQAERAEIFRLAQRRRIGTETARRLVQELDLLEEGAGGSVGGKGINGNNVVKSELS